jgi:hypothetical protein
MERLMPPSASLTQNFHETNARLAGLLDSLLPDPLPAHGLTLLRPSPRAATPRQIAALLSELMRAGQGLRSLPIPSERDAALERELSQYRKQVERLRALLPSIHGTLLGERARLEQERGQVVSAAEWAHRSRETL